MAAVRTCPRPSCADRPDAIELRTYPAYFTCVAPRARRDREDTSLNRQTLGEAEPKPLPQAAVADNPSADSIALAQRVLEDMKAEDITVIDLVGKTSLADAMIIASGNVNRHVAAISEALIEALKGSGLPTPKVEGMPACDWVLIDTGDIIVHVFRPEVRQFYNLEKMWGTDRPNERLVS
ncbi:ribosome-associated protein [Bosea sp. OAE752]|jgi:ribosome-associated protein|uniref:Ribosomal silencing factor RsfS n=1 Tax=Bosea spartocytisi TaxID=2773451 RepID=A0A927I234_9HYPH|nr:ribosome silencing factor [Bosea spartocytisi]